MSRPVRITPLPVVPVRWIANVPEWMPTDMRNRARARGQMDVSDRREYAVHVPCRVRGVLGVVVAAEQDEQRIAGEFQDVAAVVGDRQQHREDAGQRGDELLGAFSTRSRELLRQDREPRDVDEDGRALDVEVDEVGSTSSRRRGTSAAAVRGTTVSSSPEGQHIQVSGEGVPRCSIACVREQYPTKAGALRYASMSM